MTATNSGPEPTPTVIRVDPSAMAQTAALLSLGLDVTDSREAMDRAVIIATKILPGCDAAGVCVIHNGDRIATHAVSVDALREVDALQHLLSEGPCIDALQHHDIVHSADLTNDERWPHWGPLVALRQGFFSILSYRLFSIGPNLGAMSLYGRSKSAFTTNDVHTGLALASHVGVALSGAQEVEHLLKALGSRAVIGQATGIVMERFDMPPDRAFDVLRRLSQNRNVKLRALAEQIVTTRTVPIT